MIQTLDDLILYLHGWALSDSETASFFHGPTEDFLGWIKQGAKYPCVWVMPPDRGTIDFTTPAFRRWEVTVRVLQSADRRTKADTPMSNTEQLMERLLLNLNHAVKVDGKGMMRLDFGSDTPVSFTTADNHHGWEQTFTIGEKMSSICLPNDGIASIAWLISPLSGASVIRFDRGDSDLVSIAWDGDTETLTKTLNQLASLLNTGAPAGHSYTATPTGIVWRGPASTDPMPFPDSGASVHTATQVWPRTEVLPVDTITTAESTALLRLIGTADGQVPRWDADLGRWVAAEADGFAPAEDDITSTTISLAVDTDLVWDHQYGLARITTNGSHRFEDFTELPDAPVAPFLRTAIITITNPGDHLVLFPTQLYHSPDGPFPTDTVAGEQIDVSILWTGSAYRVRVVRNVAVTPDTTPQATGVTITGIAIEGNVLSHDYDFVSIEGDTEAGSVSWGRRYASEAALLADDDGTAGELYLAEAAVTAGTTRTYTATSADVGKYHAYFVRPQDDGINPGGVIVYKSEAFGPVAAAPADPTVVSVVTSAQIAPAGTSIPATNLAFAGSTAGANGKAIVFFVGDRNGGGSAPSGTGNGVTSATLGGVALTPISRRNHNAGNNASVSLFELDAADFPADGTLAVAGTANMHMGDMIVGIILLRNANQANVANFTSANGGSSTTMTLSLLSVAVNSLLLTVGGQASGGNWLTPTSGQSVELEASTASSNVEVYSERATVAGGFTETISIGSASGGAAAIMIEIRTV